MAPVLGQGDGAGDLSRALKPHYLFITYCNKEELHKVYPTLHQICGLVSESELGEAKLSSCCLCKNHSATLAYVLVWCKSTVMHLLYLHDPSG